MMLCSSSKLSFAFIPDKISLGCHLRVIVVKKTLRRRHLLWMFYWRKRSSIRTLKMILIERLARVKSLKRFHLLLFSRFNFNGFSIVLYLLNLTWLLIFLFHIFVHHPEAIYLHFFNQSYDFYGSVVSACLQIKQKL